MLIGAAGEDLIVTVEMVNYNGVFEKQLGRAGTADETNHGTQQCYRYCERATRLVVGPVSHSGTSSVRSSLSAGLGTVGSMRHPSAVLPAYCAFTQRILILLPGQSSLSSLCSRLGFSQRNHPPRKSPVGATDAPGGRLETHKPESNARRTDRGRTCTFQWA